MPRQGDRLVDVFQFDLSFSRSIDPQFHVRRNVQGMGESRSFLADHIDLHAEGLRNDENVAEDNRRVEIETT